MEKTKWLRKIFSFVLVMALIVSSGAFAGLGKIASAKTKTPKLSTKSVKVKVGSSKTVKVKNKPSGAKVTWSSKNKKIAKVKSGKITGVKKGSTKVIAKVTYKQNKKKVTKKLTVKVTVTAKSSSSATPTPNPYDALSDEQKNELKMSNVGEEHKSASGLTTKDNGIMRMSLSSQNLIDFDMGIGWNLGNQLEESNLAGKNKTIAECEQNAGNPLATQTTFSGLKKYGVNTVRIPVAWSNLMSTDGTYTINKDLMDRIETVVNYALNEGMYVIVNEHWDGGWWGMFGQEDENIRKEAWKKYESIWTQISERFKEYSDHLWFAAGNEELSNGWDNNSNRGFNTKIGETGFLDITNGTAGILTEEETYKLATEVSQKFVDIFRNSGGNNKYRHLIIPGHTCSVDEACSDLFVMPNDIEENGKNRMSVEVHIYDPQGFALMATASDEGYRSSWGGSEDEKWLTNFVTKMKKFSSQGYGIVAGECGVVKANKDGIIDWMKLFFKLCKEVEIVPCLWDEGHYYNRELGYFNYKDYGECIANWTGTPVPALPEGVKAEDLLTTGTMKVPTTDNQTPKVVYTWEGQFMRHAYHLVKTDWTDYPDIVWLSGNADGTDEEAGMGVTKNISDGLEAVFDLPYYWNVSMKCDWSKIEKPCIRIYPADNKVSKSADLQLGYIKDKNGVPKGNAKNDVDYTDAINWVDHYIELDRSLLAGDRPWLWITTNDYNGVVFEKVEICDAAYNADGTAYQK